MNEGKTKQSLDHLIQQNAAYEIIFDFEIKTNNRLESNFEKSLAILENMFQRGYDHWVVTFSGGKDSTTTLIVALEAILRKKLKIRKVDVIYSDTLIEIPVIYDQALKFLNFLQTFDRVRKLPLCIHITQPSVKDRFWTCLLGKGYPPPHQKFRWCTDRLKIRAAEKLLKTYICPNQTIILTGVRFGESVSRDQRLNYSCRRGGECGQGVWVRYSSRLHVAYLAPIVHWHECDVWDFLNYWAPTLGYPTYLLESKIYNGRETRFGCWMCTVVKQDKAMEKITSLPEWSHLRPLLEFRNRVWEMTRNPSSRVLRPDGNPGRLKVSVRRKLLKELLRIQEKVGIRLISKEEILFIRNLWKREERDNVGSN